MTDVVDKSSGEELAEEDPWTFTENPAVRALLDHIAEQLAAEFVRLMRASMGATADTRSEEREE